MFTRIFQCSFISKQNYNFKSELCVSQRKRKHGDDFFQLFKEFTENITSKLAVWKTDVSAEVSKITGNITDVKEDLLKLKEASQDLKSEINGIRNDYIEMKKLTQSVINEHSKINTELDTIKSSVEFQSAKYDEFNTKVKVISDDIKKINILESKLRELQTQNRLLTLQMNSNDQRDRLMNLEIIGIPEVNDEQPVEIVKKIAKIVNVEIVPADIIYANRITPKKKFPGRPRILIVKLSSRLIKDNIIAGARKLRLTTKEIGMSGEIKPVFINDNLTPQNKQLLKKTKEMAKTKEYQYVWSKNGRIYIRKCDTSPMIQISDEEDLKMKFV